APSQAPLGGANGQVAASREVCSPVNLGPRGDKGEPSRWNHGEGHGRRRRPGSAGAEELPGVGETGWPDGGHGNWGGPSPAPAAARPGGGQAYNRPNGKSPGSRRAFEWGRSTGDGRDNTTRPEGRALPQHAPANQGK